MDAASKMLRGPENSRSDDKGEVSGAKVKEELCSLDKHPPPDGATLPALTERREPATDGHEIGNREESGADHEEPEPE